MRVLVTGGAGYIGSSIARALAERGDDVLVFDNLLTGLAERVPDGVELRKGDLRDIDAVRDACVGVELVFHQGALRSVTRSVDNPVLSTECNVLGTLNILLGASEVGVRRLVYASSSSVYGDSSAGLQQEDQVPDPISPYAASKLAGEHYCRVWSRLHGLSTVSLRYFNVFGPGQPAESRYSLVFPAFVSALAAGKAPQLDWDGEQSRDFTYIDDVVEANLLAAEADGHVSGAVVNIAGGAPKTINEALRAVSEAMSVWIEPVRSPKRPGDVRHTRADISRAREMLDWSPKTPWKEAVSRTVAWFRRG